MNLWTRLINNNTMRYGLPIRFISPYKNIRKIYIEQNFQVLKENEFVGYMIIDNNKEDFYLKHDGIIKGINNDLLCSLNEINSPYVNLNEDILWLFDLNLGYKRI